MQEFITKRNIEHFSRLLEQEQDPQHRKVLADLLAEQRKTLATLLADDDAEQRSSTAAPGAHTRRC